MEVNGSEWKRMEANGGNGSEWKQMEAMKANGGNGSKWKQMAAGEFGKKVKMLTNGRQEVKRYGTEKVSDCLE